MKVIFFSEVRGFDCNREILCNKMTGGGMLYHLPG